MILTFSRERFRDYIVAGLKIHTIRADVHDRWRAGNRIHFWLHSPRDTTKIAERFSRPPDKHGDTLCTGTQEIVIQRKGVLGTGLRVKVDGRELTNQEIAELARNDGFEDIRGFRQWFLKSPLVREFRGKIIHWTDKRY